MIIDSSSESAEHSENAQPAPTPRGTALQEPPNQSKENPRSLTISPSKGKRIYRRNSAPDVHSSLGRIITIMQEVYRLRSKLPFKSIIDQRYADYDLRQASFYHWERQFVQGYLTGFRFSKMLDCKIGTLRKWNNTHPFPKSEPSLRREQKRKFVEFMLRGCRCVEEPLETLSSDDESQEDIFAHLFAHANPAPSTSTTLR